MLVETFILKYERDFILNLINNIDHTIENYRLLARIYKHSTPHFYIRVNTIIKEHLKNKLNLYNKNKENIDKLHINIVVALFLVLDVKDITNILFSKVIKIIGSANGITQTQLIGQLADEMFIVFKNNCDISKILKHRQLNEEEINIIKDVKSEIENTPIEIKIQFGMLLFGLLTDEFSYIFNKIKIFENNESHIYITISDQYLSVLSSVMFNPIKLPMICEPKKWSENTTGGYLLSEFNELNKNISIVRDNPYMKEHSKISKDQISTVNYLNNIPFEINNTMLDYLLLEWKNTNSVIFKEYNKLHPLSKELDNNNLDSNMKKEILKHNSIHWNYSNILNISALMREQTIYLPTFLDFRGRVYPIPVYLSYQGSDLARSLLLFKNVGLKIDYNNIIQQIVDKNIKNKLFSIFSLHFYISSCFQLEMFKICNKH